MSDPPGGGGFSLAGLCRWLYKVLVYFRAPVAYPYCFANTLPHQKSHSMNEIVGKLHKNIEFCIELDKIRCQKKKKKKERK